MTDATDALARALDRAMLASGIRCEPDYPTTLDAALALAAAYAAELAKREPRRYPEPGEER